MEKELAADCREVTGDLVGISGYFSTSLVHTSKALRQGILRTFSEKWMLIPLSVTPKLMHLIAKVLIDTAILERILRLVMQTLFGLPNASPRFRFAFPHLSILAP